MKITFNKISCSIFMGINPEEYLQKQTVLISVNVDLTTTTKDVVNAKKKSEQSFFNYNDIYEVIQTIANQQHWELQEELIFALFQNIFPLSTEIQTIEIHTEKIQAYKNCVGVGVHEMMNRDEFNF